MINYYHIQIGDLWLTSDETETGIPLISNIAGLDALQFAYTGNTVLALDGTPHQQVRVLKGVPVVIDLNWVPREMFLSLVDVINTSIDDDEEIAVMLLDDSKGMGDFDLSCVPTLPDPLSFPGDFMSEKIKAVRINLTVAAVN
jgi:hypothetical protein